MKNMYKNEQSGLSVLEMIGLLSIIGGIAVAALFFVGTMMTHQKNTTLDDDLARIARGARALYNNQPDFTNLDDGMLQFVFNDKNKKNPYDGVYHLTPNNNRTFTVRVTNLNARACTDLIQMKFSAGGQMGGCVFDNKNPGKYYMDVTFGKEEKGQVQ